jgi:hypothetical protein
MTTAQKSRQQSDQSSDNESDNNVPDPKNARLLNGLLALCATFFTVAACAALGWWWSATNNEQVTIESLSPDQRQQLIEGMTERSPGVFSAAHFEPRLGYTLIPNQRLSAWNDQFTPNDFGYRTHPVEKPDDTFRIVFVGDSWTFGMGVSEAQSYPAQFEMVAREMVKNKKIEAWNLSLPGYNTLNEITALEFFFDQLQPDAVVFSPMPNDANSSHGISPSGRLTSSRQVLPFFEDDLWLLYRRRLFDSDLLRSRWRTAFHAMQELSQRLTQKQVPLLFYFVANWDKPFVHWMMAESGIQAPYTIIPRELTGPRWSNPPPIHHANPEANALYGRIAYRSLATLFNWPELPLRQQELEVALHRSPVSGNWEAQSRKIMLQRSQRIPEFYDPATAPRFQCVGLMNCASGIIARDTMLMLRRSHGTKKLKMTVAALPYAQGIYPVEVDLSIAGYGKPSRLRSMVFSEQKEAILEIALPEQIQPGSILDVVVRVNKVVTAPTVRSAHALKITRIEQY